MTGKKVRDYRTWTCGSLIDGTQQKLFRHVIKDFIFDIASHLSAVLARGVTGCWQFAYTVCRHPPMDCTDITLNRIYLNFYVLLRLCIHSNTTYTHIHGFKWPHTCLSSLLCVTWWSVRAAALCVQSVVPSWLKSLQQDGVWEGTCLPQLPMQRWGSNSLLSNNTYRTCTHTYAHIRRHNEQLVWVLSENSQQFEESTSQQARQQV